MTYDDANGLIFGEIVKVSGENVSYEFDDLIYQYAGDDAEALFGFGEGLSSANGRDDIFAGMVSALVKD